MIAALAILILLGWGVYDYLQKGSFSDSEHAEAPMDKDVEVGIQVGNQAPDFELLNEEGQSVKLSDFQGKKVVLNFWATWCPPCRAEMPHMEKISQRYTDEAVVLAVNLTHTETNVKDVAKFADSLNLTFPIVLDAEGDTTARYQVFIYPTTYILDSSGIIQQRYQGAIDYEIMKNALAKIH